MTIQIEIEKKNNKQISKFCKGYVFFKVWQYKLKLKPRDKTCKLKIWYFAARLMLNGYFLRLILVFRDREQGPLEFK